MSAEAVLWLSLALGLTSLAGLAIYYEFRQRNFEPARRPDQIFRCAKCSLVYTDDPEVDRSRCPGCGRTNEPFGF
jgi:rubrerythrin